METLTIKYNTSVHTPAGWRGVEITAHAERTSPKMAVVTDVIAIDGEEPRGTMSRTGAKRQQYYGSGVAAREVGTKKRLSACVIVE